MPQAVSASLDFVPARLPEAVNMKPGNYEVIKGESSGSADSSDPDSGSASESADSADSTSEPGSDSDSEGVVSAKRPQSSGTNVDSDSESDATVNSNIGESPESDSSESSQESDSDVEMADSDSDSDKADPEEPEEDSNKPKELGGLPLSSFYGFNENPKDKGTSSSSGDERKEIHKSWSATAVPPVGLENRGVTCYMNAAVETLFHLPAVGRYLLEVLKHKYPEVKKNSVTVELAKLYKRTIDHHGKALYPSRLIRRLEDINCMMSEWQQEDSHEYYMSLMGRLQEDSTPKGQKLRSSIIHSIFGGTLEQKVTCASCGTVSTTSQDFYDLPVSFSPQQRKKGYYTLERSIKDFFGKEQIKLAADGKDGYQCEKCKDITQAVKQYSILDSPEYLTIHIKRFKFTQSISQKVKDAMHYPIDLDLTQYSAKGDPLAYQLVGVIVHEGDKVSSGHYIALCRQPNGTWAEYDDELVRKVSEKYVQKQSSAYMLVYSRLTLKPSKSPKTKSKSKSDANADTKADAKSSEKAGTKALKRKPSAIEKIKKSLKRGSESPPPSPKKAAKTKTTAPNGRNAQAEIEAIFGKKKV